MEQGGTTTGGGTMSSMAPNKVGGCGWGLGPGAWALHG
jgi:hypothetical protein